MYIFGSGGENNSVEKKRNNKDMVRFETFKTHPHKHTQNGFHTHTQLMFFCLSQKVWKNMFIFCFQFNSIQ